MKIHNVSNALCLVPAWHTAPCVAQVELYRFGIIRITGQADFRFLAGWLDTFPLNSPNGGGTLMTVMGAGFYDQLAYVCHLTSVLGGGSVTCPGTVVQADTIVCESPQWIYASAANVTLSLEEFDADGSSHELPKVTSRDFTFVYAAGSASLVQPAAGLVTGGYNITIFGNGFNAHPSQYSAHTAGYSANFSEADGIHSVSTACRAQTSQVLVCTVPYWEHGEMTLVLSIYQGSTRVPSHASHLHFTFLGELYGKAPNYGPVETGTVVAITGAGFSNRSSMVCVWTPVSASGSVVLTPVDYTNRTRLVCMSPTALIEHQVSLSLRRVDGDLLNFGSTLNFTGNHASELFFQILPILRAISVRHSHDVMAPSLVVAVVGGSPITISGRGFNAARDYHCQLKCLYTSHECRAYSDVAATFIDNTSLTCLSPSWTINTNASAQLSVAHLQMGDPTLAPAYTSLDSDATPIIVALSQASWTPADFHGTSMGGQALQLSGSGFCHSNTGAQCLNRYVCEFSSVEYLTTQAANASECSGFPSGRACRQQAHCGAANICRQEISKTTILSKIVNSTSLICMTPLWSFAAQITRINLYESVGGKLEPLGTISTGSIGIFNYSYAVTHINPLSLGASSSLGRNVTLYGGGFNVSSQDATCHFQGSPVRVTAAVVISSSVASCLVPPIDWYQTAALTQVLLKGAGVYSLPSLAHAPVYLQYLEQWEGFNNCTVAQNERPCFDFSAPARGESVLAVNVWGLDTLQNYECLFQASNNSVSAPLIFNTATKERSSFATVIVPRWNFAASNTSVTLSRVIDGGLLQLVPLILRQHVPFEFYEVTSHHSLMAVAPICVVGLCWPLTFTVHGFGFNPSSRVETGLNGEGDFVEYSCRLQNTADASAPLTSTLVSVHSSERLTCTFGTALQTLKYVFATCELSLVKGGRILPSFGPTFSLIEIVDRWNLISCNVHSGSTCEAYSSGGSYIKIIGMGFNANTRYWCNFTSATASVQGEDAYVLSTSRLQCKVPYWPNSAGNVSVSVHRDSNTLDFVGATIEGSYLTYLACWWIETTPYGAPNGSVAGGSGVGAVAGHDIYTLPLVIYGAGFSTNASYYIRFIGSGSNGSVVVSMSNAIQNYRDIHANKTHTLVFYRNLTFTIPPFLGHEGTVQVELFECKSDTNCRKLLVELGGSILHPKMSVIRQYIYVAYWSQVLMSALGGIQLTVPCGMNPVQCWAPASGGVFFTILGHGFHTSPSIEYKCHFTGTANGKSSYTIHEFVNATMITCPSPEWNFGATNTLLTLGSSASSVLVPKFYTYNSTIIAMLASINKVIPSRGLSTAIKVTISGNSFSQNTSDMYGPESGPYTCHFFALDPAGKWLKERYIQVDAEFQSSSELTCNISVWATRFSAANVSVALTSGNFTASLEEVVNDTNARIVVKSLTISADNSTTGSSSSIVEALFRSRAGMYVKIDKEIMLVTQMSRTDARFTLDVRRAQWGSDAQPHAVGDHVLSLIPLSVGVSALHHTLTASFNTISTTQALTTGGALIRLSGFGFDASLLDTPNTLPGVNYNMLQLPGLTTLEFSNMSSWNRTNITRCRGCCICNRLGTPGIIDISDYVFTDREYAEGVLGPDGTIYYIPRASSGIGVLGIDGIFSQINLTSFTSIIGLTDKFSSGVLTPNGKIYFGPHSADEIGVLDTASAIFYLINISITGNGKFSGSILGPNNKVYFVPFTRNAIGVLDLANETYSEIDISDHVVGESKYSGGVLASNGKIYFVPYNTTDIGVFDPWSGRFSTIEIPEVSSASAIRSQTYGGGVLGPHGIIYLVPRNANNIGVFEPPVYPVASKPGSVSTLAGSASVGCQDGGTNALFSSPSDVVVSFDNIIYVADTHNEVIRMLDPALGIVSTVAGNGAVGFANGVDKDSKINIARACGASSDSPCPSGILFTHFCLLIICFGLPVLYEGQILRLK